MLHVFHDPLAVRVRSDPCYGPEDQCVFFGFGRSISLGFGELSEESDDIVELFSEFLFLFRGEGYTREFLETLDFILDFHSLFLRGKASILYRRRKRMQQQVHGNLTGNIFWLHLLVTFLSLYIYYMKKRTFKDFLTHKTTLWVSGIIAVIVLGAVFVTRALVETYPIIEVKSMTNIVATLDQPVKAVVQPDGIVVIDAKGTYIPTDTKVTTDGKLDIMTKAVMTE